MNSPATIQTAHAPVRIVSLKRIRAAAHRRQPGHIEECLRLGHLDGGTQCVIFDLPAWQSIRARFSLRNKTVQVIKPGCC
jgi:hypothetical protein